MIAFYSWFCGPDSTVTSYFKAYYFRFFLFKIPFN